MNPQDGDPLHVQGPDYATPRAVPGWVGPVLMFALAVFVALYAIGATR